MRFLQSLARPAKDRQSGLIHFSRAELHSPVLGEEHFSRSRRRIFLQLHVSYFSESKLEYFSHGEMHFASNNCIWTCLIHLNGIQRNIQHVSYLRMICFIIEKKIYGKAHGKNTLAFDILAEHNHCRVTLRQKFTCPNIFFDLYNVTQTKILLGQHYLVSVDKCLCS